MTPGRSSETGRGRCVWGLALLLAAACAAPGRSPASASSPAATLPPGGVRLAEAWQSPLDADNPDKPLLSAAIVAETNRIRAEHGLRPLADEPRARAAAQAYCDDMVRLRFYDPGHGHPDPALDTQKKRLAAAGVDIASGEAENIAIAFPLVYTAGDSFYRPDRASPDFRDLRGEPLPMHSYASFARSLLAQWMASPHHRENLLDADWTHVGAACSPYRGSDDFPKLACAQELLRL